MISNQPVSEYIITIQYKINLIWFIALTDYCCIIFLIYVTMRYIGTHYMVSDLKLSWAAYVHSAFLYYWVLDITFKALHTDLVDL